MRRVGTLGPEGKGSAGLGELPSRRPAQQPALAEGVVGSREVTHLATHLGRWAVRWPEQQRGRCVLLAARLHLAWRTPGPGCFLPLLNAGFPKPPPYGLFCPLLLLQGWQLPLYPADSQITIFCPSSLLRAPDLILLTPGCAREPVKFQGPNQNSSAAPAWGDGEQCSFLSPVPKERLDPRAAGSGPLTTLFAAGGSGRDPIPCLQHLRISLLCSLLFLFHWVCALPLLPSHPGSARGGLREG